MLYRVLTLLFLVAATQAFADPGLARFAGSYRGAATVTLSGGQSENLTCTSINGVKGSSLTIAIRCANASSKFEARSRVVLAGSSLSGTWLIIDPSYDGTVSGTAHGDTLSVRIAGPAFSGTATVRKDGQGLHVRLMIKDGLQLTANLH